MNTKPGTRTHRSGKRDFTGLARTTFIRGAHTGCGRFSRDHSARAGGAQEGLRGKRLSMGGSNQDGEKNKRCRARHIDDVRE